MLGAETPASGGVVAQIVVGFKVGSCHCVIPAPSCPIQKTVNSTLAQARAVPTTVNAGSCNLICTIIECDSNGAF